jgi:hypothetical protein
MKNKKYTVINGEVKEIKFVEKREKANQFTFCMFSIANIDNTEKETENIYSYKQGNLNVEIALEDDVIFNEISTANLYKRIDNVWDYVSDIGSSETKKPWYKFWK